MLATRARPHNLRGESAQEMRSACIPVDRNRCTRSSISFCDAGGSTSVLPLAERRADGTIVAPIGGTEAGTRNATRRIHAASRAAYSTIHRRNFHDTAGLRAMGRTRADGRYIQCSITVSARTTCCLSDIFSSIAPDIYIAPSLSRILVVWTCSAASGIWFHVASRRLHRRKLVNALARTTLHASLARANHHPGGPRCFLSPAFCRDMPQ